MTKAGFLTKLRDAISALPAEAREDAITFFSTQLDDRIEEGMTEAEAVEALGDFREIAAALLEEHAQAAIPAADTAQPQNERGQSNRPEPRSFATESRPRTIELTETNCAVELLPSPDGQIRIEYEVTRWISVDITCDNDRLIYTAKEIFHFFHWDIISRKPARLYLPAGYLPNAVIRTGNARLTAANVSFDTAELKTGNAALSLAHLTANQLTAKTGNAALTAEHITAPHLKLTTGNAALTAKHCTADSLELKTSNSALRTEHITAKTLDAITANGRNIAEHITAATVSLTSANGRVELQNVTADNISLRTSNAAIIATLPGSIADYRIESKTVNGSSSLPSHKAKGEKSLVAVTSNGKIDVVFAADQ
ncbi:MAG: DUF4097 family beta strand repeat protein [Clostridia bacterium]|nr:DUF4097 family beta strand repeat protein [Clostridia bacterium]